MGVLLRKGDFITIQEAWIIPNIDTEIRTFINIKFLIEITYKQHTYNDLSWDKLNFVCTEILSIKAT